MSNNPNTKSRRDWPPAKSEAKRNERKKKPSPRGRPNIWASGHLAITSGSSYAPFQKREKKEPPMPIPWPGEGTLILTDKEKDLLRKKLVK